MATSTTRNVSDELSAIKAVADALEPLNDIGRRHVIAYVAELLGIPGLPQVSPTPTTPLPPAQPVAMDPVSGATGGRDANDEVVDIRSLKEQKQPRSANEMAALVAYYVSELAPGDERRSTVTPADVEKYFKQANYRLPGRVAQTLPDAARAGYLDVVERGQYKLNPVGYNLVAHGMPAQGSDPAARASARPRRGAKKAAPRRTAKKIAKKSATAAKKAAKKRP